MKHSTALLWASLAMAVLILDSKTAFSGAMEGLELCAGTVVPALLPYLFLSMVVCEHLVGRRLRLASPLAKLCRIPIGAAPLLIVGLLGGYPVGAQCVSRTYEQRQISRQDARRLLVICNNCGPAFLFGMVSGVFQEPSTVWLIWSIQIVSALAVGVLLPGRSEAPAALMPCEKSTPVQIMDRCLRTIARICGWIILFRVVLSFFDRWGLWYLPAEERVGVMGFVELTNGCADLGMIAHPGHRLMLCCAMLSFGGLCVTMQTCSVISPRLDRRLYFPGKILQGCISIILSYLVQLSLPITSGGGSVPLAAALLGLITWGILRKIGKNSSIPQKLGV